MAFNRRETPRRVAPRRSWVAVLAVAACVGQKLCRTTTTQPASPPVVAFVPPASETQAAREQRLSQNSRVALRAQGQAEPASRAGKVARSAQARTVFQGTDAAYNPEWLNMEENKFEDMAWQHDQTVWAAIATALFGFDFIRILLLIPPGVPETILVGLVYFGLYASRYQEVPKLEPHYQVSFYASCGWTFYAWVSLVHGMAYGPNPWLPVSLAEPLHQAACLVYLASCAYFYSYHWGRQIKHISEGRFRPWFAVGLASLTAVHGLTVGHILKCLDDPGWWGTVVKIYPGEWQWLADTRLLELYLTAAALFLVILHLRGVLTGTKNAAIVFLGTVILPTAALMFETGSIHACAWEHYFMVGPKYFGAI